MHRDAEWNFRGGTAQMWLESKNMVQLTNTKTAFRPSKIIIRGLFCQYYSPSTLECMREIFWSAFVPKRRVCLLLPWFSGRKERFWKTKHSLRCSREAFIEMRPSWSAGNWNFFNWNALFYYLHLRIGFSRVIVSSIQAHTAFFERNLLCAFEDEGIIITRVWES